MQSHVDHLDARGGVVNIVGGNPVNNPADEAKMKINWNEVRKTLVDL